MLPHPGRTRGLVDPTILGLTSSTDVSNLGTAMLLYRLVTWILPCPVGAVFLPPVAGPGPPEQGITTPPLTPSRPAAQSLRRHLPQGLSATTAYVASNTKRNPADPKARAWRSASTSWRGSRFEKQWSRTSCSSSPASTARLVRSRGRRGTVLRSARQTGRRRRVLQVVPLRQMQKPVCRASGRSATPPGGTESDSGGNGGDPSHHLRCLERVLAPCFSAEMVDRRERGCTGAGGSGEGRSAEHHLAASFGWPESMRQRRPSRLVLPDVAPGTHHIGPDPDLHRSIKTPSPCICAHWVTARVGPAD